jgi:alkylation response protein AidB-like acyl-CoA dehydrogenase
MHFAFSAEQLEIRDAVAGALQTECPAGVVRAAWQERPTKLWPLLAELGVLAMGVPEDLDGLGLGMVDQVLLLEEAGKCALPEPLLEAVVAIPALVEAGEHELVRRLAAGDAVVSVVREGAYALDADRADLVLVVGDKVWAIQEPQLTRQNALDGSRRIFSVDGERRELDVAPGPLLDRAAVAAAAQLLGLARCVIDMATEYAKARRQFGKPIGAFQAVQHHLADALLGLEFAVPLVHRAAWSLDSGDPDASLHASMAKIAASDAATLACRKALQVHGAIGYTLECDLHLYMKRAWALVAAWGDPAEHRDKAAAVALA